MAKARWTSLPPQPNTTDTKRTRDAERMHTAVCQQDRWPCVGERDIQFRASSLRNRTPEEPQRDDVQCERN